MASHYVPESHIIVPLDGSAFAEQALPVAALAASRLGWALVLTRVVPVATLSAVPQPAGRVGLEPSPSMAPERESAEQYLDRVVLPLRGRGLHVYSFAESGDVIPTLLHLLSSDRTRMIVLATHARTGMARFALGSVADRLVHDSIVPVLLLRPWLQPFVGEPFERAIVPLDGSEHAEAALELASLLAGPLIRNITLLRVVTSASEWTTERDLEDADIYLERVRAHLAEQVQVPVTIQTQVLCGYPAEQIVWRSGQDCDLVIMATHGESGSRRWAFGSVADRVLHDSSTPLLLVRPRRGLERPSIEGGM